MSTDHSAVAGSEPPNRLRADAERNRERVLQAAKDAFSSLGFDASYHDIARLAQVGVGTVYRRFPERTALLEAVLLDILEDLTTHAAHAAAMRKDSWQAFEVFFDKLADVNRRYAGLSEQLAGVACRSVQTARDDFLGKLQALCAHAKDYGLREDIGPRELLTLAGLFASRECNLASESSNGHGLAIRVILDGLRL